MAPTPPIDRPQILIDKLLETKMIAIDDENSSSHTIKYVNAMCNSLGATQKDTHGALQMISGIMKIENISSMCRFIYEINQSRAELHGQRDVHMEGIVNHSTATEVFNLNNILAGIQASFTEYNRISSASSNIFNMEVLITVTDCFDSLVQPLTRRLVDTVAAAHFDEVYQTKYHERCVRFEQPHNTILERIISTISFSLVPDRELTKTSLDDMQKTYQRVASTGKVLREFATSFGSGFLLALSTLKWQRMCELSPKSCEIIRAAIDVAVPDLRGVLSRLTLLCDEILARPEQRITHYLAVQAITTTEMEENRSTLTMRQLFQPLRRNWRSLLPASTPRS